MAKAATKTRKKKRAYDPRRIRSLRRSYDLALDLVEQRREKLQEGIQEEYDKADVTIRVLAEDSKFTFGRIGQIVRGEG